MNRSRHVCALAAGLMFLFADAHGQPLAAGPDKIRSVSGQFVITVLPPATPYYRHPEAGTNRDLIQLNAPLLAISAERFKLSLWRLLGLGTDSSWNGKIFLNLRPARSTDEEVVIATESFIRTWNYRLELPDLISQNRYARALSAVLLLEIANRHAPVGSHPAAVPQWLADGLARLILEADSDQVILSTPTKSVPLATPAKTTTVIDLPLTRLNETRRGIDPLAGARRVLQNSPALTFDQLSWPDDDQSTGKDGGVYLASVQLFVSRLLDLPEGDAQLRNMLARLPVCENWQTAFYAAFQKTFKRPLDVEKWWALQVVNFAARDPGPRWTATAGGRKLDALLLVPVDIRYHTNAWPVHTDITLQTALRSVEPERLDEILFIKLRDLDLIQFRLSAQMAGLAAGYRAALADFLGEQKGRSGTHATPKRSKSQRNRASAESTIKKLDELDGQRRKMEAEIAQRELQLPGR
jgi:hypothetical protein